MNIIEHNWNWAHGLSSRSRTDAIVLHHAAAKTAAPEDVHRWHLNNGWAGFGYHLYIRKDGSVHRGRPIWASGAHTLNFNSTTLGVCCEGNYNEETVMPVAQLQALREVLTYLKQLYPAASIKCHRDYNATACPGKWFPLGEALKYETAGETAEREETMAEPIYKDIKDVPKWYRPAVQKLLDADLINGGTPKEQNATDVNLTETQAKLCHLFVNYVDKAVGRTPKEWAKPIQEALTDAFNDAIEKLKEFE